MQVLQEGTSRAVQPLQLGAVGKAQASQALAPIHIQLGQLRKQVQGLLNICTTPSLKGLDNTQAMHIPASTSCEPMTPTVMV